MTPRRAVEVNVIFCKTFSFFPLLLFFQFNCLSEFTICSICVWLVVMPWWRKCRRGTGCLIFSLIGSSQFCYWNDESCHNVSDKSDTLSFVCAEIDRFEIKIQDYLPFIHSGHFLAVFEINSCIFFLSSCWSTRDHIGRSTNQLWYLPQVVSRVAQTTGSMYTQPTLPNC